MKQIWSILAQMEVRCVWMGPLILQQKAQSVNGKKYRNHYVHTIHP
jgi:hypothetical protein